MNSFLHIFTAQQWVTIIAAGLNAIALGWLLRHYFNSRFWIEAVTDVATGRVVGGDIQKAGAFALACVLTLIITIAKLAYQRDAGPEVTSMVYGLLVYSGALQDIKRRGAKDVVEASKPAAPANQITVTDSTVGVGPNGSTQ